MSNLLSIGGAGNPAGTGFYNHLLDQSLKFNDDDSQYLTRTPASAGNRKTWTWSAWVKRGNLGGTQTLFARNDASVAAYIIWNSNNKLEFAAASAGIEAQLITTPVYRDASAFYHIVMAFDTTQTTASDRIKFYINGVQITSLDTASYPSQNYDGYVNTTQPHYLGSGAFSGTLSNYFDGYIAEVNMIDGTALTAASFGETKDGIWIPKDTSGLTFGTNGFHLTFKDDVVSEGFNVATFSGTGANQSISGLGFSPDLLFLKSRSATYLHYRFDSVRGPTKRLTNTAGAESTTSTELISFDADGFTVGSDAGTNQSGGSMVAWAWEAGGAPTADNSAGAGATPTAGSVKIDGSNLGSALAGSIAATRLTANTARGFSITSFVGTGSAGTIAHCLSASPELIIVKNISDGTKGWPTQVTALGNNYLELNTTNATFSGSTYFNNTAPTSSVFSVGTVGSTNASGNNIIAYCFHSVTNYSSIGSYSGNGSSTGPTVTTGFPVAFVMIKRSDGTGNWYIWDTTRHPSNPNDNVLYADLSNAESVGSSYAIEVTATGFQIKHSGSDINASGGTFIYMAFADTREAAFFKDVSTNGNHFTPVNLDYRDSVPDSPTNNFATLNPLMYRWISDTTTLSEGNLKTTGSSGHAYGTMNIPTSGKWYWEAYVNAGTSVGQVGLGDGILLQNNTNTDVAKYVSNGTVTVNSSDTSVATYTTGDIIGIACDSDSSTVTFYKNNSSQASVSYDPSGKAVYFGNWGTTGFFVLNHGQDSSFAGLVATSNSNADGNGHGSFAYAPPSGFLALCSQNLPEPEIIDGSTAFSTVLYTGTSNSNSVTGVGFSPNFTWLKQRNSNQNHGLFDSVRGSNKFLISNDTAAENTRTTDTLSSFDSDGFTLTAYSSDAFINYTGRTMVAWNWLAGTAFSNDASATGVGTVDSTGQINTTAGFSVITFTGGSAGYTVAHGLSQAPEIVFTFNRTDSGGAHYVFTTAVDGTIDYLSLDNTNSKLNDPFSMPAFTSTVFSLDNDYGMDAGDNCVAYCFHSVEGYSKVGSFEGNNSSQNFVYTGFRPSWLLLKNIDGAYNWMLIDSVREPFNDGAVNAFLRPNLSIQETTAGKIDIVSNGFVLRDNSSDTNASATFIYLAFAEQPFKFANAR